MELCNNIKISSQTLYDVYSDTIYFINEEMKDFLEYSVQFDLERAMKKWDIYKDHEVIDYLLEKGLIINTDEYQKRCILGNVVSQGSTFFEVASTNLNKFIMESRLKKTIGFIGVPFNRGSIYNNISIDAPNHLRELSNHLFSVDSLTQGINYYSTFFQREVNVSKDVLDFGNVNSSCNIEDFCYILSQISNYVSKSNVKPIYIGGDHSITEYIVKGISENYMSFNILHIDAHTDLTPSQSNHPNHSSVVYRISKIKEVKKVYMMGLRGFLHKEEREEIDRNNKISWINHAHNIRSNDPLYITIDIDVFDSSFIDSVSYPNFNGWTPERFLETIIEVMKHNEIIAIDVVEYDSNKDLTRKSGTIVNSLILELQQYL